MNNSEKLDDIRRRLRRIETRGGIIQRVSVIVFELVTGRAFPSSWVHSRRRAGAFGRRRSDERRRVPEPTGRALRRPLGTRSAG
jgi:hypothetical protein